MPTSLSQLPTPSVHLRPTRQRPPAGQGPWGEPPPQGLQPVCHQHAPCKEKINSAAPACRWSATLPAGGMGSPQPLPPESWLPPHLGNQLQGPDRLAGAVPRGAIPAACGEAPHTFPEALPPTPAPCPPAPSTWGVVAVLGPVGLEVLGDPPQAVWSGSFPVPSFHCLPLTAPARPCSPPWDGFTSPGTPATYSQERSLPPLPGPLAPRMSWVWV